MINLSASNSTFPVQLSQQENIELKIIHKII